MREGWVKLDLEKVAILNGRIGWKGLTAKEYTKEGPLFLSVHSLNYGDYVDFREAFHISQQRYDESPEIMLENGDILICKDGAGIGKLGIVSELPGEATVNSSLLVIRPQQKVLTKYLYYNLLSPYFQKIVQDRLQGATTPHLYQRDIKTFPVNLVSTEEQKLIVGILDQAFAAIDQAKANIEKNIQNAKELFQSKLNEIFSQKGEGWEETTLAEQVDLLPGYAFKSKNYTTASSGISLLRGENIMQGYLRWENIKKWPKDEADEYEKFQLRENDIVLAMDRPWVSAGLKVSCIKAEDLPCLQVQRTARLRSKGNIHWRFLFNAIQSDFFVSYILGGQTGMGVPHISGKQILSFSFNLPPRNQQELISSEIAVLSEAANNLQKYYQTKLDIVEELKKSLLQKAFAGELTAVD